MKKISEKKMNDNEIDLMKVKEKEKKIYENLRRGERNYVLTV